ncbi:hypothetical protein J1614_009759 [Plenodomus biglobosus]|nr:hypothetical protein J1614_009759 [Plenodomus biglobosus]
MLRKRAIGGISHNAIHRSQCDSLGELIRPTRSTHCDPKGQRITTKLFLRCTRRRSYGAWHSDWDSRLAVVTASRIYIDALNADAIGGCCPCHARSAEIAYLSINELLGEVVVLESLEWPGRATNVRNEQVSHMVLTISSFPL